MPWIRPNRRGNIRQLDPPSVDPGAWQGDRRDLVRELKEWAEREAVQTIDWYFRDKATKRGASRLLRGVAILLAVVGGILPLIALQTGRS